MEFDECCVVDEEIWSDTNFFLPPLKQQEAIKYTFDLSVLKDQIKKLKSLIKALYFLSNFNCSLFQLVYGITISFTRRIKYF